MRATVLRPAALACAILISACNADQPMAPPADGAREHRVLQGGASDLPIQGTQNDGETEALRATPIRYTITTSRIIGAAGGTITIPSAGVTLTVPAGALTANTEISISARKGAVIAYDIKPFGLVFKKPVTFKQNLRNTNAAKRRLSLRQFSPGAMTPSASISGTVDELTQDFTAPVSRASGYIMSCGRHTPPEQDEM